MNLKKKGTKKMNENNDKGILYDTNEAVKLLNKVDGFEPKNYLREETTEEGKSFYLDTKFRLLWYRLKYPDGKLVKIDKTQTGSDGSQAGSAGSATQTGSDSAQAGNNGATSQQTGNTNTTGNNTHVTAPAQPADSSASTRTTGTTHNDTSVTTRHTNVPA